MLEKAILFWVWYVMMKSNNTFLFLSYIHFNSSSRSMWYEKVWWRAIIRDGALSKVVIARVVQTCQQSKHGSVKTCIEARGAADGRGADFHWSNQALLAGLSFLTQSVGRFLMTCSQQCMEDFTDLWGFSWTVLQNVWKNLLTCEDFHDLLSEKFGRF